MRGIRRGIEQKEKTNHEYFWHFDRFARVIKNYLEQEKIVKRLTNSTSKSYGSTFPLDCITFIFYASPLLYSQ